MRVRKDQDLDRICCSRNTEEDGKNTLRRSEWLLNGWIKDMTIKHSLDLVSRKLVDVIRMIKEGRGWGWAGV